MRDDRPILQKLHTFSDVAEATRVVQPAPLEFEVSSDKRGLALKSLTLVEGFEGFLRRVFNETNEVYFLAWCWDLSGKPVVEYPGATTDAQTCIIPMVVGKKRKFNGAGINLFPARNVTAGLAVRIMIWESDQDDRNFGKAMSEVSNSVKNSGLNKLLTGISSATGVTMETVSHVKDAAIELADAIGKILQANSDDYVDFFEGYYPTSMRWPWRQGVEKHTGTACEIELTRF